MPCPCLNALQDLCCKLLFEIDIQMQFYSSGGCSEEVIEWLTICIGVVCLLQFYSTKFVFNDIYSKCVVDLSNQIPTIFLV